MDLEIGRDGAVLAQPAAGLEEGRLPRLDHVEGADRARAEAQKKPAHRPAISR
jgi:hypothetical protein